MQATTSQNNTCRLTVADYKGEHSFSFASIIRMEAADNYTIIYFNNYQRPFTVSKVLKVYEEMLSPFGFIRIHRSHLVNKQFIRQVNRYNIVMKDASVVNIAKRKRTFFTNVYVHNDLPDF